MVFPLGRTTRFTNCVWSSWPSISITGPGIGTHRANLNVAFARPCGKQPARLVAEPPNTLPPPVVLSDRSIREQIEAERIVIDPFDQSLVQPSSVDVRVDRTFRVFHNGRYTHIDVREPMEELTELVSPPEGEPFILHPGEFVLGQTLERVTLPDDLVARLEGKSSLGRLGLLIHSTAGFVDSGFSGNLTLELSNVANLPI